MNTWISWTETVLGGLMLGGLYGLIGLGLALAFGVLRVVNIAHGECMVLASYLAYALATLAPELGLWWSLPLVMLAAWVLGWLLHGGLLGPVLRSGDPLRPLLITFGLSVVLRNLMVELFGADPRGLQGGALVQQSLALGELHIGLFPLLLLLLALALFLGLNGLLQHTRMGRVIRASADNAEIVRLMGASPDRAFRWVMGLSLAFAALAGVMLGLRSSFTPFSGVERLLLAFEVVIVGGMGSLWGALLGGMALGLAQMLGLRLDPNAGSLYSHLLFLAILLVYPQGLAGGRR